MIIPKILHIAQDEKFINAAYYLFEKAFPGANRFVIVKPPANPPNQFLNAKVQLNADFEVRSGDTVKRLADLSSKYEVTVFHGLDKLKGSVFLQAPHKNRIMTNIYGAEIYNKNVYGETLLGPKTTELSKETERETIVDFIKEMYRKVAYKDSWNTLDDIDIGEVLYNMRVFGSLPSFPYDRFIENKIYNPAVKKVPFSYYPIEFIIKDKNLLARGQDILLGNSAASTNNHLEAFDFLKDQDIQERKIVAPLSYGNHRYAKAIVSQGKKMYPGKFIPLTEFLPIEEYNKIISQCGIVIMNHYRPQAMGNIIASLFMGAKVFLNKTEAYRYFNHVGCHIFSIEEDLKSTEDPFQLLTDEQISHNREMLKKELSTSVLVEKLRTSFNELFDFNLKSETVHED